MTSGFYIFPNHPRILIKIKREFVPGFTLLLFFNGGILNKKYFLVSVAIGLVVWNKFCLIMISFYFFWNSFYNFIKKINRLRCQVFYYLSHYTFGSDAN